MTNLFEWVPLIISSYDETTEKFKANWRDPEEYGHEEFEISRINFCLDAEDPRKFAKRVANAHKNRIFSDSLIRYNYYIDNMPI
jgi:dynein heavy chain